MEKFNFLKSVRFWKIVIAFVFYILGANEIIPMSFAVAIEGVLGVSVAIRTVDRFGEKVGK
jgi:hypothetical protein